MPVKWTPDVDQLLLIKILETHDVNVDAKKIASAWPTDKGEAPTPRAITERLVRIRAMAKASGAGGFGISSSQKKSTTPGAKSSAGTSRKSTSTTASTPSKSSAPKSSPAKRTFDETDIKGEPVDSDDEKPIESPAPLRNGTGARNSSAATISDFDRAVSQQVRSQSHVASDGRPSVEDPICNLDGAADYNPSTSMARLSFHPARSQSPTKKARKDADVKKEQLANGLSTGVVSTMAHFAYDDDNEEDDDAYAV